MFNSPRLAPKITAVSVEYDGVGKQAGTRVRKEFKDTHGAKRFHRSMWVAGRNPRVVATELS